MGTGLEEVKDFLDENGFTYIIDSLQQEGNKIEVTLMVDREAHEAFQDYMQEDYDEIDIKIIDGKDTDDYYVAEYTYQKK